MPTDTLARLLDESRSRLLAGDLAMLGPLAESIEAEIAMLGNMLPESMLELREKAKENSHLLTAAIKGVRAAKSSFDRQGDAVLSTYDEGGNRKAIAVPENVANRRI